MSNMADNTFLNHAKITMGMAIESLNKDVQGRVYDAIVQGYERGAQWASENPNDLDYVSKAAFDYADKTTGDTRRMECVDCGDDENVYRNNDGKYRCMAHLHIDEPGKPGLITRFRNYLFRRKLPRAKDY